MSKGQGLGENVLKLQVKDTSFFCILSSKTISDMWAPDVTAVTMNMTQIGLIIGFTQ